jgi:hypothetical protein
VQVWPVAGVQVGYGEFAGGFEKPPRLLTSSSKWSRFDDDLRNRILGAQRREVMVNASDVADDVVFEEVPLLDGR